MGKTYFTVLKASFAGQPTYFATFETEAQVLDFFQNSKGFVSLEVVSEDPAFRTLKVRYDRVLFPTETYYYREAAYGAEPK